MIILEDIFCGAAELYCSILTGVCIIYSTLIDTNGLDIILETPHSMMQHNLTVPNCSLQNRHKGESTTF